MLNCKLRTLGKVWGKDSEGWCAQEWRGWVAGPAKETAGTGGEATKRRGQREHAVTMARRWGHGVQAGLWSRRAAAEDSLTQETVSVHQRDCRKVDNHETAHIFLCAPKRLPGRFCAHPVDLEKASNCLNFGDIRAVSQLGQSATALGRTD